MFYLLFSILSVFEAIFYSVTVPILRTVWNALALCIRISSNVLRDAITSGIFFA